MLPILTINVAYLNFKLINNFKFLLNLNSTVEYEC